MTRLPDTPATDAIERMSFMLKAAVFVNANTTWDMKQEMENGTVLNVGALEDSSIVTFRTGSISGLDDAFSISQDLFVESPFASFHG